MELANRELCRVDEYEPITNRSRAALRRKRNIAGAIAVTLLVIVIVLAIVFIRGSKGTKVDDRWKDLPPLRWDGDCPAETSECPQSFRGRPPPLLLISLDGFRADYISRADRVPTLLRLSQCGVRARFFTSVYPSKTFPNHFTQVTGLYPSSHGIIDNSMHDPRIKQDFKLGSPSSFDPKWWPTEPIWVSAEKQDKRTATFFWPGSDVEINGRRPTYYKNYTKKVPFETRVLQVLDWLDLPPPLRPSFLTLYFNEPDSAAHDHGTNSHQVNAALERVDRMVAGLFAGLQVRNLTGCVNVFISSDHGMADIDCDRVLDLREYINVSDVRLSVGTFGRLGPMDNSTSVSQLSSSLRCKNERLRVFRKENLPVRMHYWDSPRIEPVIVDTDSGWTIFKDDYAPGHKYCTGGAHGYDNYFPDMRAFFTAIGPSMKRNVTVDPFLNIELYELMCELIDIAPNPNNGTRGSLHHLLRAPHRPLPPSSTNWTVPMTAKVAKEFAKKIMDSKCFCAESDPQVDLPEEQYADYHFPFGAPASSASVLLVRNQDYVLGYDEARRMARWASFTINSTELQNGRVLCWRADARIPGSDCANYDPLREEGLLQWPLYPPVFSGTSTGQDSAYVTNSVPVSVEYATNLADEIWGWLRNETSPPVHVITGPAFAPPHHREVGNLTIPSHIFVIAVRCPDEEATALSDCPTSSLEVDAFLLPSHPYTENCEAAWRVIEKNAARVIDVEGATGLEFFTGLPQYDALRLRTALPSLVTRRQL